jgi:hypothetical protein
MLAQLDHFLIAQRPQIFHPTAAVVVDLFQEPAYRSDVLLFLQQLTDARAQSLRSPAQMRLQDLTDVHA